MHLAVSLLVLMAAGLCSYGWGLAWWRLLRAPPRSTPTVILTGLALLLTLGGWLHLAGWVRPWVYDLLTVGGWFLFLFLTDWRRLRRPVRGEWPRGWIGPGLVAAALVFTLHTQLPPRAFNWHDDFEKYLVFPVRLLQTGTLAGNPLNALGSETLGGQAFLHAWILRYAPLPEVHGVDAVAGLLLCLLCLLGESRQARRGWLIGLVGLLAVLTVNPQVVNTSALYLGAAFMMAGLREAATCWGAPSAGEGRASAWTLGLLLAALVSLKTVFVVFPALLLASHLTFAAAAGKSWRTPACRALTVSAGGAGALFPWVAGYLPRYLESSFAPPPLVERLAWDWEPTLGLWSTFPLPYGGTFAHYTWLAGSPFLLAAGWFLADRRCRGPEWVGLLANTTTVLGIYLVLMVFHRETFGYVPALRYAIPFLLAGAPLLWGELHRRLPPVGATVGARIWYYLPLFCAGAAVVSFAPSALPRWHQAWTEGNILAFRKLAADPGYQRYCREAFTGTTATRIQAMQNLVPPGEPFVAWISTPFLLDYRRQEVFEAERSGLATPWARLPEVRYFLWEHTGPAVRTHADLISALAGERERFLSRQSLVFLRYFEDLRHRAQVLQDDGRWVLLRLDP